MEAAPVQLRSFRLVWLLIAVILITSAVAQAKPNIVLILADDFGYECVTANGGQSYQTPNIDRLAARGERFEQCHVQPLCTPTRAQLMTGRYNVRNYINFGTLLRTETTFGSILQGAGYATGICGKWQLGHETDSPQHFGFTESCLWQQTRRPPRYANPGLEYNGVGKDFTNGEYGPTLVNDFALEFITRHQAHPFFLYYPMMLTHDPFQPTPDSPDWDPKSTGEGVNRDVKHFADMTAYMDKLIGTVLAKLDELKLRENTLVIFLGDNGTLGSVNSRFQGGDYRGGKASTNAHGTHVPLIVNWPSVVKPGGATRDLISSVDLLPTLCEAAGATVPEIDGISFLPQLRGQRGQPREWLYSWYSPRQGADKSVREFAFDHDFKLYRNGEFFDLKKDSLEKAPIQLGTLAGEAAIAAAKLQAALKRFENARPTVLEEGEPAPRKKNK